MTAACIPFSIFFLSILRLRMQKGGKKEKKKEKTLPLVPDSEWLSCPPAQKPRNLCNRMIYADDCDNHTSSKLAPDEYMVILLILISRNQINVPVITTLAEIHQQKMERDDSYQVMYLCS